MLTIGDPSPNPAIPAASDPNPYRGTPLEVGSQGNPMGGSVAFADEPLGIDPIRLLEITRDVCQLANEYRTEMGIEYGNPEPRWGSWAWWRRIARSEYAGRFAHRYMTGYGGVFDAPGGNLSLGVPARFVATRAAGHQDNLVGTDPFVAAMPMDIDDDDTAELSKQVEEKVQDELTQSNFRGVVREGIRVALCENETTIKLTWVTRKAQRPELRPVAVYAQQTEAPTIPGIDAVEGSEAEEMAEVPEQEQAEASPLRTPKGDFIFEHDDIILTLADDATGEFVALYAPGSPVPDGQNVQMRLKKEPAFVFDPATMLGQDKQPIFQTIPGLIGTDTLQNSLEGAGILFEDFLYDIKVPKLKDAPLQIHVYDDELDRVLAAYGQTLEAVDRLDKLASTLPLPIEDTPKSGASQPKREYGEYYSVKGSMVVRKCNIHESYYRVRINPSDEHETWLFLVIDYARQVPLHAEYLGNMRMKSPPFRIVRGLESVPSRAYGVGIYQKFHERNLAVDYWFNRAKLKTTKNASVDFLKAEAFIEAQDAQDFVIGGTEVYRIKSEMNDKPFGPNNPVLFRETLTSSDAMEWEMIDKIISSGMYEFGLNDMGQLRDVGAPISKDATATATRSIERTGNTLQRSTENMMVEDLTELVSLAVDLILENSDLDALKFTDDGQLLAGLNRDEIRDLPRHVRLTLTKARSSESLANNQQAVALIEKYNAMPAKLKKDVRFAFIAMLRSLDVQDADNILKEPTDEEIAAEAQAQQQPPKESISINYKDAPPDIQRQMEQEAGFKPSTMLPVAPAAPQLMPPAAA